MEFHELPFDELCIIGIQSTCESTPVGQESESAPVLILIDVVEELYDGQGILHLFEILIGASIPLQVVYGALVSPGDPPVEADSTVTGGVCSHWEEDIVACHTLVPCDGVEICVAPEVSDMKISCDSRICEDRHEFGLTVVSVRLVQTCFYPTGLPFLFHRSVIVCHSVSLLMVRLGIRRFLKYLIIDIGAE